MKKVISLALAVVMLFSVFAILPTASAAETVYKAGTEVQAIWKMNCDEFSAIEFIIYYGDTLEYVVGSGNAPHIDREEDLNEAIPGELNFNASDDDVKYDISEDHVVFKANFIVKEDVSKIDVSAYIEDVYIIDGTDFVDIEDWSNEFEFVVVSAPTEPEPKTVYFVNTNDWADVYVYAWNSVSNENVASWPGEAATKTELTDPNGNEVYSYTFTGDFDKVIFNNNAGTQTADLTVSEGENKYYYLPEGKWYDSLDAIPVVTEGTTAPPVVSLMGTATDWETGAEMTEVDGVYTTTLRLAEGTYEFKVKVNDTWFGNDGTIVDTTATSSETGWDMFDGAPNCKLQATGGIYTFSFNTTTNKIIVLAEIEEKPSEDTEPTEDTTPSEKPSEELKNGIYEEDGTLYYYKDGAKYYAGLIMIDGDYYYVNSSCVVITGKKYTISKTNYLLPRDVYEFDETGKMVNPPVKETIESTDAPAVKNGIFEENGVLFYYKDNAKFYAGLIMIDGYYYYVNSSCRVITDKAYYISKTNNLLPSASYMFDLDGKMINPPVEETEPPTEDSGVKNGFVVENGVTYYYVDGVKTYAGLIEIDGDLYYVNSSCKVIMGMAYYISKTNNLKERGTYTFDTTGKMVNP